MVVFPSVFSSARRALPLEKYHGNLRTVYMVVDLGTRHFVLDCLDADGVTQSLFYMPVDHFLTNIHQLGISGPTASRLFGKMEDFKFQDGSEIQLDHHLPITLDVDRSARTLLTNKLGSVDFTPSLLITRAYISSKQPFVDPVSKEDTRSLTAESWPESDPKPIFTPVRVPTWPGQTRIGYAVFENPIQFVRHTRQSHVDQMASMRQTGTVKRGTGQSYESYTLTYMAHGPEEIKRSVQEVLEQINLQPFVAVEGGPFGTPPDGGDIPSNVLAVRNFTVSTVQGFPNTLLVEINADPFMYEWYMPPSPTHPHPREVFDDFVCYPLYKLWAKTRARSTFGTPENPLPKFDGIFELSLPNEDMAAQMEAVLAQRSEFHDSGADARTLQALVSLVKNVNTGLSRRAKEIILPQSSEVGRARSFTAIFDTLSAYERLVFGAAADNARFSKFLVGFIARQKVEALNFTDAEGSTIPWAHRFPASDLSRALPANRPVRASDHSYIAILDLRVGSDEPPIPDQVRTYFESLGGFMPLGQDLDTTVQAAIDNPHLYWAPVFLVRPDEMEEFERLLQETAGELGSSLPSPRYRSKREQLRDVFDGLSEDFPELTLTPEILLSVSPNRPLEDPDQHPADRDIVIEQITGTRGHNLSLYSTNSHPLPIHQYMGGIDATFVVRGKCFGLEAKARIEAIKSEFDERALRRVSSEHIMEEDAAAYNRKKGMALLRVKNEIFQLMGVDFVLPLTVTFQSVDGQPQSTPGEPRSAVWDFTITFVDFDPSQKNYEALRFLNTTNQSLAKILTYGARYPDSPDVSNPTIDRALEYFSLQDSLKQQEVYPDLALPTSVELHQWVTLCKKLAKLRMASPPGQSLTEFLDYLVLQSPSSTVSRSYNLTEYEKSLVPHILPFLEFSAPDMAGWHTDYFDQLGASVDPESRVDPDFYISYDPDMSWGNMMDNMVATVLGKPNKDLTAQGLTDDDPVQPSYLLQDPSITGAYWVADHNFFSMKTNMANPNMSPFILSLNTMMAIPVGPNMDAAMDLIRLAEKTMDDMAGNRKWWAGEQPGIVFQDRPFGKVASTLGDFDESILSGIVPGSSPSIGADFGTRVRAFPPGPISFILPLDVQSPQSVEELGPRQFYYDVEWRKQFMRWVWQECPALWVPPKDFAREDKTFFMPNTFASPPPEGILDLIFGQRLLPELIGGSRADVAMEKVKNGTPKEVEDFIKNAALHIFRRIAESSGKPPPGLRVHNKWVFASASRKHQLARNAGKHLLQPDDEWKKPKDLDSTFEMIDAVGHAYEVDPHVIRAVFMMRDSFGTNKTYASPENSVGDFILPEGAEPKNPYAYFASKLSHYAHRFRSVTLGLLVTHMELTDSGRREYWNDYDRRRELFEDINRMIGTGRPTAREIQAIVNKYVKEVPVLSAYTGAYINLCRVYGSYPERPAYYSDSFFDPLDPRIVGFDVGGSDHFLRTAATPTGEEIVVPLHTSEVFDRLGAIVMGKGKYDMDRGSLENQIMFDKRYRVGLDPKSETSVYGSLLDLRKHSPFSRLLGAFPAYSILIINEGYYWQAGNRRIWDQFYSRSGVAELEVFRTRHSPASTCNITFSNMFHKLTSYTQMEAYQSELARRENARFLKGILPGFLGGDGEAYNVGRTIAEMVRKEVPEDLRRVWQNSFLSQLALTAGARVHVRMGYGANAAKLPIVFNGTVVQAPVNDGYVTLVCAGDGAELLKATQTKLNRVGNAYPFADGGFMGTGKDPVSILSEAMVAGGTFDSVLQGNWRDMSGKLAHFGDVVYFNLRYSPAEMQINLYRPSLTKLESALPSWKNYLNVNALYNYESTNLFSVEVREPNLWKIANTCRMACMDFVTSAEHFGIRSTLFFGKPWWPYHYAYAPSILKFRLHPDFYQSTEGFRVPPPTTPTAADVQSGPPGLDAGEAEAWGNRRSFWQYSRHAVYVNNYYIYLPKGQDTPTAEERRYADEAYNLICHIYRQATGKDYPDKAVLIALGKKTSLSPGFPLAGYMVHFLVSNLMDGSFFLDTDLLPDNGTSRRAALLSTTSTVRFNHPKSGTFLVVDYNGPSPSRDKGDGSDDARGDYFKNQLDLMADVHQLQQHLNWKPYTQVYFAHSMINLLSNDIKLDSNKVYTDAVGIYNYNGVLNDQSGLRTISYSLDTDIIAADRKTLLVETGLQLTAMQEGLAKAYAESFLSVTQNSFIPFVGPISSDVRKFIQQTPTTPALNNSVVSGLIDAAKEMYQGWFTVFGMPTVKPHDLFVLTDHTTSLRGPVKVKEVIHRLDSQVGFVTLVSPDLVVLPQASEVGKAHITTAAMAVIPRITGFYTHTAAFAALWYGLRGRHMRKHVLEGVNLLSQYSNMLGEDLANPVDKVFSSKRFEARMSSTLKKRLARELAHIEASETATLKNLKPGSQEYKDAVKSFAERRAYILKKDQTIRNALVRSKNNPARMIRVLKNNGLWDALDDDFIKRLLPPGKSSLVQELFVKEFRILVEQAETIEVLRYPETGITGRVPFVDHTDLQRAATRQANAARVEFLRDRGIKAVLTDTPISESQFAEALDDMARSIREMEEIAENFKRTKAKGAARVSDITRAEIHARVARYNAAQARLLGFLSSSQATEAHRMRIEKVLGKGNMGQSLLDPRGFVKGMFAHVGQVTTLSTRSVGGLFRASARAALAPSALGKTVSKVSSKVKRPRIGTVWQYVTNPFKLKAQALEAVTNIADETKRAQTAAKLAQLSSKMSRVAKEAKLVSRIVQYAGPQVLLRLLLDTQLLSLGNSLVDGASARMKARQVAVMFPLMAMGNPDNVPFVAGIRGHQGAVVGDDPSWVDQIIMKMFGTIDNPVFNQAWGTGMTLLSFLTLFPTEKLMGQDYRAPRGSELGAAAELYTRNRIAEFLDDLGEDRAPKSGR